LLSLVTIDDISTFSAANEIRRLTALPVLYEQLLLEHEAVHKELYSRVALRLQDRAQTPADDEALWKEARGAECASPSFIEKIFIAGCYEILSSCGERPPNLQGVWAGNYHVPWSGDYTKNGNLQTAISGLLPSGDF